MSTAASTQVGFLLADWDEKIGPQIIAQALPGITEDPEALATQSYISAQQVFCSAEFSRVSFVLPNMKIQRKAKLYFDIIKDDKVRGGQRPFLLAAFLPLNVPDTLFLKLDPIIEPIMEYKNAIRPDLTKLTGEVMKIFTEEGKAKEPKDELAKKDQVLLIKVNCEICKHDLPITFSKSQLRKEVDSEFLEYTYLHGAGEKGITPHGVKITVDPNYALNKIEYVDIKGDRISPFQDQDIKALPAKIGAWLSAELQTLAREMRHGTPLKSLSHLFQRPVPEIEQKMKEIENEKMTHFNKVLGQSIAEAKKVEQGNPKEAKKLWNKIVEYCLEFIQSPGVVPRLAANIRQKTQAIKARADKL